MDKYENDYQLIKHLVKVLEESTLHELKVKLGSTSVQLTKTSKQPNLVPGIQPVVLQDGQRHSVTAHDEFGTDKEKTEQSFPGNPVNSPMVGTFYRSPSPDAVPFVKEGDQVKEGDILCIVEAMKMMNPIKAPSSGRLGAILIQDGQPVEYGQHMMMIID